MLQGSWHAPGLFVDGSAGDLRKRSNEVYKNAIVVLLASMELKICDGLDAGRRASDLGGRRGAGRTYVVLPKLVAW